MEKIESIIDTAENLEENGELVRIGEERSAWLIDEKGAGIGEIDLGKFLNGEELRVGDSEEPVVEIIIMTDGGERIFINDNGTVADSRDGYSPKLLADVPEIEIGERFKYKYGSDRLPTSVYTSEVKGVFAVIGSKTLGDLDNLEDLGKRIYVPFDPWVEFDNCFNIPDVLTDTKEGRKIIRSRLNEFQEKLIWQKAGIANAIGELYKLVNENPDVTYEEYEKVRDVFAKRFLLTSEQIEHFNNAFSEYQRKHKIVNSYRERYPNDDDLFEVCFGDKPLGKVEVIKTPLTLHFLCHSDEDYIFVNTYYSNKGSRENINPKDRTLGMKSSGCAFPGTVNEKDLAGVITVERVTASKSIADASLGTFEIENPDTSKIIQDHEQQHLFNALFVPNENSKSEYQIMENALKAESLAQAARIIIHDLLLYQRRKSIDPEVRNEILAYLREGSKPEDILNILSKGDLYDFKNQDYMSEEMSLMPTQIKMATLFFLANSNSYDFGSENLVISESYIKEQMESVFGEEYKKDLKIWTNAVSILEKKRFTRKEILNLLYQEPVNSWINLARRMRERIRLSE